MGTLFLVATPIGNLKDITIRAIDCLLSADIIACEDSRRSGQLMKWLKEKYGKQQQKTKLISFYDEIEEYKTAEILDLLKNGKTVALVSDSGTPMVADPGFKLVKATIKAGIKIESLPGPSSVLTALTVSGLPSQPFYFLGFLPAKANKKKEVFSDLARFSNFKQMPTVIFFESPHRLRDTFKIMLEVFSDIEIAVCRELTKVHEEVWRGRLSQALNHFFKPKGEFVILFKA